MGLPPYPSKKFLIHHLTYPEFYVIKQAHLKKTKHLYLNNGSYFDLKWHVQCTDRHNTAYFSLLNIRSGKPLL